MDLVSIIIIGYNVEKYIKNCIESVTNQTYKNLEIIFVDDGSTDNTSDIVKSMTLFDKRILYFYQKNQGANSARKYGYKKANGKYISFVDGDDYIDLTTISNAYKKIKETNADIICFDYFTFNANGIIKQKHAYLKGEFYGTKFLDSILKREQAHFLWNKLYTTHFLNNMDFLSIPSITMGDDFAANIRMGVQEPFVVALDMSLYFYRSYDTSISRKVNNHYTELNDMMIDVRTQLKANYNIYEDLINYNYFLNFYYYVVRNKSPYGKIQKSIYKTWKDRNISLSENSYIQKLVNNCAFYEKILIRLINYSDLFEYIITKIYDIFARS